MRGRWWSGCGGGEKNHIRFHPQISQIYTDLKKIRRASFNLWNGRSTEAPKCGRGQNADGDVGVPRSQCQRGELRCRRWVTSSDTGWGGSADPIAWGFEAISPARAQFLGRWCRFGSIDARAQGCCRALERIGLHVAELRTQPRAYGNGATSRGACRCGAALMVSFDTGCGLGRDREAYQGALLVRSCWNSCGSIHWGSFLLIALL